MSLLLVAPEGHHPLKHLLASLRHQTICHLLEVVVVAPEGVDMGWDESEMACFHSTQLITLPALRSIPHGWAVAAQAAQAEIVALCEDHSFPQKEWAQALLDAHAGPWPVVSPVICNANPRLPLSWANLLIDYGGWGWLHPAKAGTRGHLPGHNSSYKVAYLRAYGEALETLLGAESVIHWELRAKGHELYLNPAARTDHLNHSVWLASMHIRFLGGRQWASYRARAWSRAHRAVYVLGGPLIPFWRFLKLVPDLRAQGLPLAMLPSLVAALLLLLACSGLGEMVGYARGLGGTTNTRLLDVETNRFRFLARGERETFGGLEA